MYLHEMDTHQLIRMLAQYDVRIEQRARHTDWGDAMAVRHLDDLHASRRAIEEVLQHRGVISV